MNTINLEDAEDGFYEYSWLNNLSPRDRAKISIDLPKTVWLFGAGASHHYQFNIMNEPVPLANGFFKAFHNLPTSQGFQAYVGPLINFLSYSRGVNPFEVSEWSENIEDFMTSVEYDINLILDEAEGRRFSEEETIHFGNLAATFSNMHFLFANVINEAQNGPSESLYKHLLKTCSPNDTFITFNWDTLLDRALADTGGWSPNNGYGIGFSRVYDSDWKHSILESENFETNWKLLKLHGSTNWLVPYTSFNYQTREYQFLITGSDEVFLYWQSTLPYKTHHSRWRGGYAPTCYCYYPPNLPVEAFSEDQITFGKGKARISATLRIFSPFSEPIAGGIPSSPLLITPVRQKRYERYQTSIESIWAQTKEAISNADKLIIIGYSFPPTDARILELLKETLAIRGEEIIVEIVSPSAEQIVERLKKDTLADVKRVIAMPMKFEDYLEVLFDKIPEILKTAAKKNEELREWLERIYMIGQASIARYSR